VEGIARHRRDDGATKIEPALSGRLDCFVKPISSS
jgi:hypothetical protein